MILFHCRLEAYHTGLTLSFDQKKRNIDIFLKGALSILSKKTFITILFIEMKMFVLLLDIVPVACMKREIRKTLLRKYHLLTCLHKFNFFIQKLYHTLWILPAN